MAAGASPGRPLLAATVPPAASAAPGPDLMALLRASAWLFLLPMFFQLPYYKPETGPLYLLAKVFPALLAPLAIHGAIALRLPDRAIYLLFLVYALAVTPFLSMVYLPNGLADAIAATSKSWPVSFYLSVASILVLLRPSERTISRAVAVTGGATFVLMVILWNTIPAEWYQPGAFGSNMFSWDDGRGDYIRMPMMLAEVVVFWLAHRFARQWRLWQLAAILGALASMMMIYKARLPTGVTIILVTAVLLLRLPVRWRWMLGALAAVPATLGALSYLPEVPGLLARAFDESLFIRLRSIGIGWAWVTENPVRLLFGMGSISTFSEYTLSDFFRSPDFWLTDIGWLGVLMEYGLVGMGLIVAIHARALIVALRVRGEDPFRCALATYVLFEIMCSAVYSVMYAPGPVVTVAAIAWWLGRRDALGVARDERGPPRISP